MASRQGKNNNQCHGTGYFGLAPNDYILYILPHLDMKNITNYETIYMPIAKRQLMDEYKIEL